MNDRQSTNKVEPRSHWPLSVLSTITAIVNMALPLGLVRLLSQEQVGQFKLFFLYLMILPVLSLTSGLRSGLPYWVGQKEARDSAIRASSFIVVVSAFIYVALCMLFEPQLKGLLGWKEIDVMVFTLALFAAIGSTFVEEAFYATGRVWTGAIFSSVFEIVRTLLCLSAAFLARDPTAVFVAHTTVVLCKFGAGYLYGYHLGLVGLPDSFDIVRRVWRYALPVSCAWIFGVFFNFADQFILSRFIDPRDFALYAIGCLSIPPLIILEQSVVRVLIPQLSKAFAAEQSEVACGLYCAAVKSLAFLLIPAVTGLIVFAQPIIELLFTSEYSESSHYLRMYALTYLILMIPYDAVARARGEAGWILRTFAAFSTLTLALTFAATLVAGPVGALLGNLLGYAAMRCYALFRIQRKTGWEASAMLPLAFLVRSCLVSATLAGATLFAEQFFSNKRAWFLFGGPLFALLYLAIMLLRQLQLRSYRDAACRNVFDNAFVRFFDSSVKKSSTAGDLGEL